MDSAQLLGPMHDDWSHQLDMWHEFYLLIGTAGATLTGLLRTAAAQTRGSVGRGHVGVRFSTR